MKQALKSPLWAKFLGFFAIVGLMALFFYLDLDRFFNWEFIQEKKGEYSALYKNSPMIFLAGFFAFFVFCMTFAIPGSPLLILVAGFIFDFFTGLAVVSLGGTLGAYLCFLISRFFLRDFIQKKFSSRLKGVNRQIAKDGAFYVFSLRLIPILPFTVINLMMGVSKISGFKFTAATFLGLIPGSLVYVNAGQQLAQIKSLAEILSPSILLSFLLLAGLPWIGKALVKFPKKLLKGPPSSSP